MNFELEPNIETFSGQSWLRIARGSLCSRLELKIPLTALATFRKQDPLAGFFDHQIGSVRKIMNDRADRNFKGQVLTVVTVAELAAAVHAVLSVEFFLEAELPERAQVGDAFCVHAAAEAAVAARGPRLIMFFVNAIAPLPPLPAAILIVMSSINILASYLRIRLLNRRPRATRTGLVLR